MGFIEVLALLGGELRLVACDFLLLASSFHLDRVAWIFMYFNIKWRNYEIFN